MTQSRINKFDTIKAQVEANLNTLVEVVGIKNPDWTKYTRSQFQLKELFSQFEHSDGMEELIESLKREQLNVKQVSLDLTRI